MAPIVRVVREMLLTEGLELLLPLAELKKELGRQGVALSNNDELLKALRKILTESGHESLRLHYFDANLCWNGCNRDEDIVLQVTFTPKKS